MRAVISTVSSATVSVDGRIVAHINQPGLLVLVGIGREDAPGAWETLARKIAHLRLLPDSRWDEPRGVSAADIRAPIVLVSQFTLMGATARGRRPSWAAAAPGDVAEPVIDQIADYLRQRGLHVETGEFGASMRVESVNEGPYTVFVEA